MRRCGKKDANHKEIVDALRAVGASILDTSALGSGMPDLVVGYRQENFLIEIKNPKNKYGRKGLNDLQKEWVAKWSAPVHVVRNINEALRAIGATVEDALKATRKEGT